MWQENIIQWKEETTAGSRISTDRSAYDIQTIVHSLQHSRNVSCLCQCHSKGCEARWAGIFDTFEAYAYNIDKADKARHFGASVQRIPRS